MNLRRVLSERLTYVRPPKRLEARRAPLSVRDRFATLYRIWVLLIVTLPLDFYIYAAFSPLKTNTEHYLLFLLIAVPAASTGLVPSAVEKGIAKLLSFQYRAWSLKGNWWIIAFAVFGTLAEVAAYGPRTTVVGLALVLLVTGVVSYRLFHLVKERRDSFIARINDPDVWHERFYQIIFFLAYASIAGARAVSVIGVLTSRSWLAASLYMICGFLLLVFIRPTPERLEFTCPRCGSAGLLPLPSGNYCPRCNRGARKERDNLVVSDDGAGHYKADSR